MRFSPKTWSLLSLLLFAGAIFFWLKGNEYEERRRKTHPATVVTNTPGDVQNFNSVTTQSSGIPLAQLSSSSNNIAVDDFADTLYPNRLRNTKKALADLMRDDHAILLANALIDTESAQPLNIPASLRAQGDPGSYIVQWNGPATPEFRARLAEAGAQIVSYVPNNAYLVKVDATGAQVLEQTAGIQAVVPFEPYYKLQRSLLAGAVRQELLPDEALLRLTLLPGTRDQAVQDVKVLGASILAEESSPFGPQIVVHPTVDGLAALAGLNEVQGIEPQFPRKPAADLSRVVLGVATNGSASNYLSLNGSNIWVNVNDTGIDTNHPTFQNVPISVPVAPVPMAGTDPDGHGTFVASLIAGNGAQSPTNIPGSDLTNAVYRGMAPSAKLLALPLSGGGGSNNIPFLNENVLDSWLIDSAARTNYITLKRTNSLISNNSWTYGVASYDSAAARYDAAVRDAIPGMTGSQPLLFVFAAGNSGFGNDEGGGGELDTIESPGTAKNVITVGALESFRLLTNVFSVATNIEFDEIAGMNVTNYTTNYPFAALTDSSNQVASFSSRGNVGVGEEGSKGRFKPDVVAPGAMLVAARSRGWNFNGFDTNEAFGRAYFDLHTNIQQYRFDSGTTFAAANVSGLLALLQQYFEAQAPTGARGPLSPALMKALLINGSRSIAQLYDLNVVNKTLNLQGWGVPNLPSMLSSFSTNSHQGIAPAKWHLRTVEQSPTNALATGESRTWNMTLSSNALIFPLRVTLAWTDPPGNPAVGVKLVNDLDLIVTNLDTGTVFYGNNIPAESDFNTAVTPIKGGFEPLDSVNNVENVLIRNPKQLGQKFSITVRAHRVNVNAIPDYFSATGNTNDVVQDFAMVVSSDIGFDPSSNDAQTYLPDQNTFDTFNAPATFATLPRPGITVLTNGLPLVAERVGANSSLVSSNGITNQWSFYIFNNISISNSFVNVEAGSNVAFVTFEPLNLSIPRNLDADLDIYVSKDPTITNLNPAAISAAFRSSLHSTDQGGTETVVITNATIGDIYYIGIKSEDQQAAEFSLIGVSSAGPFEKNGNPIILTGVPLYAYVPDGSARRPVAGTMVAIGLSNRRVARATVTTQIAHQDPGDLVGVLSHNRINPILNNHRALPPGTNTLSFDDSTFFQNRTGGRSDGPGSLNNFAGQRIAGAWLLQEIDNTPGNTGRVQTLTISINPMQDPLVAGRRIHATNQPGETLFFPVEVGPGVTNLTFSITNALKLEVYFRQFQIPDTNAFDLMTNAFPPSTQFSFPTTNTALLSPGTHYVAVENTNKTAVVFDLRVDFGFGIRPGDTFDFTGQAPRPFDAATTNTTIFVQNDKLVAKAQVSVHLDYPRIPDLVVSLLSPQGTRELLAENRGGTNAGYGSVNVVTNSGSTNPIAITAYTVFTDDTNIAQVPIKFAAPQMALNRTNVGNVSSSSFEKSGIGVFFSGDTVEQPWIASGNSGAEVVGLDAFNGTNAVKLSGGGVGSEAGISASISTEAGRSYRLSFASRVPGIDYLYWTERVGAITTNGTNFLRATQLGNTNLIFTLLTNTGIGSFGGVSVDPIAGYVYSGDRQFLFRTDLGGRTRTNLVRTQNAVADVEVDPANSWIYWSESGPFTRTNSIKRVRPDGTQPQVLLQLLLGQISGIALDAARNTLYYTLSLNSGLDSIQAIDLGSLQRRVIKALPNATVDPFDIDFDQTTQTLVFNEIGTRSFWRMNRDGSGLARIFTNSFNTINGFALNSSQQQVIFNGTNTIYSRSANGSNQVQLATVTPLVTGRQAVLYEEVAHLGATGFGFSIGTPILTTNAFSPGGSNLQFQTTNGGVNFVNLFFGITQPLIAEVNIGGVTNSLPGTADWTTNAFYFVGTGGSLPITIQAVEGSIEVDNVVVERVADTFVLPEEPLETIIGQRAIGLWQLVVQDSRTGAFLSPGSFDWKLDLNFSDPLIFAETLTGGSRFSISSKSSLNAPNRFAPGVLRANDVHYFIIQPCAGAQNLTVFLQGVRNFDGIQLLADTSGIPTGNPDTDDFVPMENNQNPNSPNGVLEFRLTDKLPAPAHLTPKPIFIAIRNLFQEQTNIYSLTVSSDGNCTPATREPSFLQANQSEVGGLASSSEDYTANEMGLHALNIPVGAQTVQISVEADADVAIIVQKDEPPTTDSFTVSQDLPGSANEQLTLSASGTVPLTPGVWYVRVLNNVNRPISYVITATGDLAGDTQVLSVQAEITDGQVRLNWNANAAGTYQVQASDDLASWTSVATLSDGGSSFVLPDVSALARFYRVVLQQ